MLWHSGEDSGKDDDRCTIAYASLCDEITEPEEDHSTCSDEEHSREHDSKEVLRIDDRCSTRSRSYDAIEKVYHTIALREGKWYSEISCIVIDFFLSLLAFLLQGFERWYDDREQLDDDRSIDIRCESHEYDRELLESTSHDRSEKRELSIGSELLSEGREEGDIHTWNWYSREELVYDDHSHREDDLLADMFSCPDFFKIGDHVKGEDRG